MQDRAILTRQAILTAAAGVFEERGYRAATISEILARAGVTRGALYFHFPSKEDLAEGVIREQDGRLPAASRQCAVQQLVDTVVLHAHRLRTDPVVRAGVRLALDQQAEGLDRGGSFRRWREVGAELLEQARERASCCRTWCRPRPRASWWGPSPGCRPSPGRCRATRTCRAG